MSVKELGGGGLTIHTLHVNSHLINKLFIDYLTISDINVVTSSGDKYQTNKFHKSHSISLKDLYDLIIRDIN